MRHSCCCSNGEYCECSADFGKAYLSPSSVVLSYYSKLIESTSSHLAPDIETWEDTHYQ
jgi:hypothetical protein